MSLEFREHFMLNMVPVVWEVVDFDSKGVKLNQNTICMQIADSPWVCGAEFMPPELFVMSKQCYVPVRDHPILRTVLRNV